MTYVSFDVLDIYDIVGKRNIGCAIAALRLYWKDILLRKRSLASVYLRSPYAFKLIKSKLNAIYRQSSYSFTLQTQSLWDSSSPLLRSYIYTDHVHLAKNRKPSFTKCLFVSSLLDRARKNNLSQCGNSLYYEHKYI